jgi:pimeloyl-ACP methyl ester carboxylesterase
MGVSRRAVLATAATAAAAAAGAAGVGYLLHRRAAGPADAGGAPADAGTALPADLVHHHVGVSDGGVLHVVERGSGPAVVLVHGVTLGVAVWARQLHDLGRCHRVIAVGQRGHGQSTAGSEGYSFDRMARDLVEVLDTLDVRDAVLVGHSMGGMVALTLAVDHRRAAARHVGGLVLASTTAGPAVPGPLGPVLAPVLVAGGARTLRRADRRGRGLLAQRDLASWATRSTFGARARPADVELVRSMATAMSPAAMSGLLGPLLHFDVRRGLGSIDLPTRVVVGSRDIQTPPRAARALAGGIPGAILTVLDGCGHTVMLERRDELAAVIEDLAREVAAGSRDP